MLCPHCNRESDALFKFCLHCGKELAPRKAPSEGKAAPKPVVRPRPVTKPSPSPAPEPAPQQALAEAHAPVHEQAPQYQPSTPVIAPATKDALGRQQIGFLVSVHATDIQEAKRIPLYLGTTILGRTEGEVTFPDDDLLSPQHLKLDVDQDQVAITCLGSRNGTFIRIIDPVPLLHGDIFRMGQQLLRYEDMGVLPAVELPGDVETEVLGAPVGAKAWGRLTQVVTEGLAGSSFLLTGDSVFLGRERGAFTFPGDRYISGTHACIVKNETGTWLKDVGSSNGTYFRITSTAPLAPGQFFLAGRQLFRLDLE